MVEGPVTYDFTLHLRVHDRTTWFWRCLGTVFGHFLLGSHNFMVAALGLCVKWPLIVEFGFLGKVFSYSANSYPSSNRWPYSQPLTLGAHCNAFFPRYSVLQFSKIIIIYFKKIRMHGCPWHACSTKRATILPTIPTSRTLKPKLIFNLIKFPPRFEGTHPKMKGMQQSTSSCEHNEAIKHEKPHTTKKLEKNCWKLSFWNKKMSKRCIFFGTFAYSMLK